jgi:hypothetical protein
MTKTDLKSLQLLPPWDWPPGARKTLHQILRDRGASEADREIAARLAGETVVSNDQLVADLLTILMDSAEPEALRAGAAIALGPTLEETEMEGFDDSSDASISEETFVRAKAVLKKIYSSDKIPTLVRRKAVEAAVRASEEWQTEAVRQAYLHGDPEWKLTAVFCMGYLSGFDKQILESLDSDDEDLLYEAVGAAGGSEVKEAWPRIARILKSAADDKPLLLAAIEAAPNVNFDEAESLLLELIDSEDQEIAEAAEESLELARAIAKVDDEDDYEYDKFYTDDDQR